MTSQNAMQKKATLITEIFTHAKEQPFISLTAFAALVHSTWTLGTLFSGMQPAVTADAFLEVGLWFRQHAQLLAWLTPALAIAVALDVGQVVTSHDIRNGNRAFWKYATFFVFALATYYLQWVYMVHHAPDLPLGAGVRAEWLPGVTHLRDLFIWLVPMLLPASTLFYTFSHPARAHVDEVHSAHDAPIDTPPVQLHMHEVHVSVPQVSAPDAPKPALPAQARISPHGNNTGETANVLMQDASSGLWAYTCPHCGKAKSGYAVQRDAQNAAASHIGRWCKVKAQADVQVNA